mgnify:CR=1 FL=1
MDLHKFNCILISSLPPQLVDDYIENGTFVRKLYSNKEILHFEGDFCQKLEIILSGTVVVERIGETGSLLRVTSFNEGSTIGANLLFSSTPYYPMTVTAHSETEVLSINKAKVLELSNQYPKFMESFMKIISDHTLILGTKIKHHVSRTIREGIVSFLSNEYLIQQTYTINLNITKKALAEHMGVSRTSLSRELQKMVNEELITVRAKSINILDPSLIRN